MRSTKAKVGFALMLFLMALGWLLALGGTAQQERDCRNNSTYRACENAYRFTWWIISFELIQWIAMIILVARDKLPHYRVVMTGFLVLVTTWTMGQADTYLTLWNTCKDLNTCGNVVEGISAAAAGFVFLTMLNFIWIMVVGSSTDSTIGKHTHGQPTGRRESAFGTGMPDTGFKAAEPRQADISLA